jgi:hypothetical protein
MPHQVPDHRASEFAGGKRGYAALVQSGKENREINGRQRQKTKPNPRKNDPKYWIGL